MVSRSFRNYNMIYKNYNYDYSLRDLNSVNITIRTKSMIASIKLWLELGAGALPVNLPLELSQLGGENCSFLQKLLHKFLSMLGWESSTAYVHLDVHC